MLNLFLLAGQAQGQMFNQAGEWRPDFEVKSCNRLVDNEPEMTLSIKQEYFEDNLRGIYDDDEFTLVHDPDVGEYRPRYYNTYVKTVPEDELLVDFDDECKYKTATISLDYLTHN